MIDPVSPLTSVVVVCRTCPNVFWMDVVVRIIDTFVDPAPLWTLVAASTKAPAGLLRLVKRIASYEPQNIDLLLKHQRFDQALVPTIRRGDVDVAKWLVGQYDTIGMIREGVRIACQSGQLELLQWLVQHHASRLVWRRDDLLEAVSEEHPVLARWLFEHSGQFDGEDEIEFNLTALLYSAAASGDLQMANWVHDQCKQRAVRLRAEAVRDALYPAARSDLREVMEYVCEQFGCTFGQNCLEGAVVGGQLDLMQWIHSQAGVRRIKAFCLMEPAGDGRLDVITWALDNLELVDRSGIYHAAYNAARGGHLEIVKKMYESGYVPNEGNRLNPIDGAASHGHLEVIKWLHAKRYVPITSDAMENAIRNGHLEVVQWLYANMSTNDMTESIRWAAGSNQLEVVQWLDHMRPKFADVYEGWARGALDFAASAGHLSMAKWLVEHQCGARSANPLDSAASSGHLDVVKWLHDHQIGEGTTRAMDDAAANGHLNVLRWLHANRSEGCTSEAFVSAARGGRNREFMWLLANKPEQVRFSAKLMAAAVEGGDLEIVIAVKQRYQHTYAATIRELENALEHQHYEMFEWLVREYGEATPGLDEWMREVVNSDRFHQNTVDIVVGLLNRRERARLL